MAGYRITRQQEGTRVSWWPDPRGPNHPPHLWGTIIQHLGNVVLLVWDEDDEFYEAWAAAEMRYRIDRGQMRLRPPPKQRRLRIPSDELLCKTCGMPRKLKCDCPRPGALKPEEWSNKGVALPLTRVARDDSIELSNAGHQAPQPRKGETPIMAKTKTEAPKEELLSAKEAATAIGTDARTLRKFLRKQHGLVGQGNRWTIDAGDIEELKTRFEASAKAEKEGKPAKLPAPDAEIDDDALEDALEEIDDEDLEELS